MEHWLKKNAGGFHLIWFSRIWFRPSSAQHSNSAITRNFLAGRIDLDLSDIQSIYV